MFLCYVTPPTTDTYRPIEIAGRNRMHSIALFPLVANHAEDRVVRAYTIKGEEIEVQLVFCKSPQVARRAAGPAIHQVGLDILYSYCMTVTMTDVNRPQVTPDGT